MKKLPKKLIALRLAKKVRQLLDSKTLTVIAITGSIGKTSAKVAIGQLLSSAHQVQFSEDSYNTDIGLPLSFFGLKAPTNLWDPVAWHRILQKINSIIKNYPYDIIVLEMADDELEDMMKLLAFIKPSYGVITGVARVHMDRMGSIEKVIHDNCMIASQAKTVIYNGEFESLAKQASKIKNSVAYGTQRDSIRFGNIVRLKSGNLQATLYLGKQSHKITTKMVGVQSLSSLLAAASVASQLGMEVKDIAKGLAKIEGVNGRMRLIKGVNGSSIIDDSYNSSPVAAIAALGVLGDINAKKRIAILGNMNELGEYARKGHYEVGKVAAAKADMLIVIGRDAEINIVEGAKAGGMDSDNIKMFKTPYEVGHFLKRILAKGDVVLVKGSQNGVFLEEAVRILLDPSLNPKDFVVRQSKSWQRKKRKAFGL